MIYHIPDEVREEYMAANSMADALKAKDARIAALEAQLLAGNDWLNARHAVLQDLAEANARIAELKAALKPFAAVYDENYALIGKWHDGGIQGLFLSDLLAARAALEKK